MAVISEDRLELTPDIDTKQDDLESRLVPTGQEMPTQERTLGKVGVSALKTFPISMYKDVVVPMGHAAKLFAKHLLPFAAREKLFGEEKPTLKGMEKVLGAVWEDLKVAYGGEEAIKKTIAEHPARVLNDISTVALGFGGLAKKAGLSTVGKVATKAGQIVEPINIATAPVKVAGKVVSHFPFVPRAERLYESALKPIADTPLEAKKIARYGLDKKISIRYGSWMKMEDQISQLGKKVDDIISAGTAKGDIIDLDDLTKHYDYIQANMTPYVNNPKVVSMQIERAKRSFVDFHKTQHLRPLNSKDVQKIKRTQQQLMKNLYGEMNKTTKAALNKGLAYDSRIALEKLYPELKDLNIPLGEMIEFNKNLGRVVKIHEKTDFVRNIAFLIKAVADQPYLKSKLAIWLNKVQRGHPLANPRALERNLMMQLGRVETINELEGGQ
jgi:hypothetical protein